MKKQIIKTNYLTNRDFKKEKKEDVLVSVIKDDSGKKEIFFETSPKIKYYVTKKEYRDGKLYNRIPIDRVFSVTANYYDIYKSMVEALNEPSFTRAYNNIFNSDVRYNIGYELKKLHLNYNFHNSDINIEDFFIDAFLMKYDYNDNYIGTTKSFYDIEVDTVNYKGFPNPEKAECPINIVTIVFEEDLSVHTLMLKYDTDTYKQCIDNLDEITDELVLKYNEYKEGLGNELNFNFYEFDEEIELIEEFFNLVNEKKPDFAGAWNASFDFCTFYNRIINLGYKPEDIICPKDIPDKYRYVSYYIDRKNTDPADKSDEFKCVGYTNWIDSMNLYAAMLKMDGKLESYSLDFVSNKELGFSKDDTGDGLHNLHNIDYKKFCLYNIQDSMLLYLLEKEKNHMESIYLLSMMTHTRLYKTLKKTISLRNFSMVFHRERNLILSNNRSSLHERKESKTKGAFVADPKLLNNVGKKIIEF